MKKLMLGLMMVAVAAGCETVRPNVQPKVQSQKPSEPTLYDLTRAEETRRPEKGAIYVNDSRRIKVFQTCVEVDEKTKEETLYVLADGDDLVIAVISKREYVDDEYLLPGKYLYCGPYQYMTAPVVQGVQKTGTKTVRMFMEVTDEEAKQIEENKRAEKESRKK